MPTRFLPVTVMLSLMIASPACDDEQPPPGADSALEDAAVADLKVTADGPLPDAPLPDKLVPDQAVPDLPIPDLPPPTCTDKKKNGDETDIDCGGATCPKCPPKKACKQGPDCLSGVCSGGVCQDATCSDKIKNADETDVDCGGGACPKCADTKACAQDTDCLGGLCKGGKCVTHTSCATIKASNSAAASGTYTIKPSAALGAVKVYCDMKSHGGGWTLVARVKGNSTTHTTASALGTLTSPTQATTAKLSDALINAIATTRAWVHIPGMTNVFVNVTGIKIDLRATASYAHTKRASYSSVNGPFTLPISGQSTCSLDCGVFVAGQYSSTHTFCGYRYYTSSGAHRPGMGCKTGYGKDGVMWVR